MGAIAPVVMEILLKKMLFFVDEKKRPKEALFLTYKKNIFEKD